MGYSSEEQKKYYKKYYKENKEQIAAKQAHKEACPYCGRSVRHDNLWKHTKTAYCRNRRALNAEKK